VLEKLLGLGAHARGLGTCACGDTHVQADSTFLHIHRNLWHSRSPNRIVYLQSQSTLHRNSCKSQILGRTSKSRVSLLAGTMMGTRSKPHVYLLQSHRTSNSVESRYLQATHKPQTTLHFKKINRVRTY
jgi:hypothetical protein